MPLPHHDIGPGVRQPSVDEGGVVAAQVQRAGDGFLIHHKQSTADLVCV
jgi:hypothetical protein